MRLLIAAFSVVVVATTVSADDKDEDKAKEAAAVFLKAVKAQDADAVMKIVDVPFAFGGERSITKMDDLKGAFAEFMKDIRLEKIPDSVGRVFDVPTARKLIEMVKEEDRTKKDVEALKQAEKVMGGAVYIVSLTKNELPRGAVIVRVKGEQAFVVWVSK